VRASRRIEPEALARIAGRSATFAQLATQMRCSKCGKKAAEVVVVAKPRPRGVSEIRTDPERHAQVPLTVACWESTVLNAT
jgi:hypothetical protein